MAAPGKPGGLRWGTFLSSAVQGVESRLDSMLSEEEQQQQKTASARPSPVPSPSPRPSNLKPNDRLQARLAKAMAGKNPGSAGSSPRGSVDLRPPGGEEGEVVDDARESVDGMRDGGEAAKSNGEPSEGVQETERPLDVSKPDEAKPEPEMTQDTPAATPQTTSTSMTQLSQDVEEIKVRQNEEIQEYVERIDSLQAKLQYLSRTAAESAKKTAAAAPSGSAEKKLADKDEKIALLMEEGQKLSNTEQKFRVTIRKLRAQMAENEKQALEVKKARDKAVADMEALQARVEGSDESEKRQDEARRATAGLQKELDGLRAELLKKDEALRKQDEESRKKAEQVDANHADAMSKALAAEREKQRGLEETIAELGMEKEALEQKSRAASSEWKEKLDRAVDRGRVAEAELKMELTAAEGKLEAMRAAAEEASSGSGGESQVKLLRQIETLQSQYASASDNWQGIEASLLAKTGGLEKERDEAVRRESEMRKKARDATTRGRRFEDDLQDLQATHGAARQDLQRCREELANLRAESKASEAALGQARQDLEKRQRSSSRDDRRQWVDDVATSRNNSRPESPLMSIQRTFSSEFRSASRSRRPTPGSPDPDAPPAGLGIGLGGPSARRFPGQGRASIAGSMPPPSPFPPPPETLSEVPDDAPGDVISVSTVAAGPSVQLVERMSAAVRKLEAEKVAAREEMARVQAQRDEARGEILGLMKDVQASKAAVERVTELEAEVQGLNGRYQTTLEMLGEKSELVEELRADVQDVKGMYRELVERTVS